MYLNYQKKPQSISQQSEGNLKLYQKNLRIKLIMTNAFYKKWYKFKVYKHKNLYL